MPLETVELIVLLHELGVVLLDLKEPGPALLIELESELQQVTELAQSDVLVLRVVVPSLGLHQEKHHDDLLADSVPEDFSLLVEVLGLRAIPTLQQFDQVFESETVEGVAFAKPIQLEVIVFNVVILLPEPHFDVIKDVAAQRFE